MLIADVITLNSQEDTRTDVDLLALWFLGKVIVICEMGTLTEQ